MIRIQHKKWKEDEKKSRGRGWLLASRLVATDRVIKQALPRRIFMRPFETRAFHDNFVAPKKRRGEERRSPRGPSTDDISRRWL